MKTVLLIVGAGLVLASAPAVADDRQVFDWNAQRAAYDSALPPNVANQCFNGKAIAGINRAGAQTLYVQPKHGGVYQMRLAEDCDGLNAARQVSLRADGSDLVCPGERAQLVARTASGAKQCRVADLKRLTRAEMAALSSAPVR